MQTCFLHGGNERPQPPSWQYESRFCEFIFLFLLILLWLSQFFPLCPPPPRPRPTPTVHPHTAVHVHGSFIHVLWLILFPFFPPFSSTSLSCGSCQSVPCFHVLGTVLLVSLFCSLDSSYRDHMVFVFHWLAYFTSHNALQFHPRCRKG